MIITGEIIKAVCPNIKIDRAHQIAGHIDFIFPAYGLKDRDIIEECIARMIVESDQFRKRSENMNYSAKRIVQVWPSRFALGSVKGKKDANEFAHNPVKLANETYGKRLGNTEPNDGYDYRGYGFMMNTGKAVSIAYMDFWKMTDTKAIVNLCRNDDWWAVDSAAWYFAVYKNLIPVAKGDRMEMISILINGGKHGLPEVMAVYNNLKKHFK